MTQLERNTISEYNLLVKLYGKNKNFTIEKNVEDNKIILNAKWLNKNDCFENDMRIIHGDGHIELY